MTLFSLCDCFSQWKLEGEAGFKGFSWCWWGRQRYFGAVLGLTNVFLVSHIKVGAKYNFSSGARTQAGPLWSWVGGHVATMRSDRFDLQEMIPRLRCNCGDSSNGESCSWESLKGHWNKVSVAACGHRSATLSANTSEQKVTFAALLPCWALPSLQASSPLLDQTLSCSSVL